MSESLDSLERRIEALRAEVRRAVTGGDRTRARALRAELRTAERAWEDALTRLDDEAPAGQPAAVPRAAKGSLSEQPAHASTAPPSAEEPLLAATLRAGGPLLPIREQVHQALTLLGAPAAQRLITAVHEAFFGGALAAARLTSLRRDEERSFRAAPNARPYYLCAALTYDLLAPARGLLAVSTWPMERRVIGPLSPRVHYLEAAVRVAEALLRVPDPGPEAVRLLRRFAVNIPGAADGTKPARPQFVAEAARAELVVHQDEDQARRREAAARARAQLDDAGQLFGARLRGVPGAAAAS